jgi:uncharacterized membrane protein
MCLIILFLLFNTGFINEISGAPPNSFALGMNRIRTSNDPRLISFLYGAIVMEQDHAGARWISKYMLQNQTVCADATSTFDFLLSYAGIPLGETYAPTLRPSSTGWSCNYNTYYVYLNYENTVKGIVVDNYPFGIYPTSDFSNLFYERNKIYSNGATVILASEH